MLRHARYGAVAEGGIVVARRKRQRRKIRLFAVRPASLRCFAWRMSTRQPHGVRAVRHARRHATMFTSLAMPRGAPIFRY